MVLGDGNPSRDDSGKAISEGGCEEEQGFDQEDVSGERLMDELIKAVFSLYAGSSGASLRALTTGGMWLSQAPQQSTGVYIVVTPIVAPIQNAMSTDATKPWTQDCDIQFTFSTLNGTTYDVLAAEKAFFGIYQHCSFSMTGNTLLVSRRINTQGPTRDDFTRGYMMYAEYRFTIGG